MLIPHLHFDGTCREAISFYERAFDAKADSVIEGEDGRIIHAEMRIHGIKIFLNDRFGKKDTSTDIAIHLIVTFGNREDLIACHEKNEKREASRSIRCGNCPGRRWPCNSSTGSACSGG